MSAQNSYCGKVSYNNLAIDKSGEAVIEVEDGLKGIAKIGWVSMPPV